MLHHGEQVLYQPHVWLCHAIVPQPWEERVAGCPEWCPLKPASSVHSASAGLVDRKRANTDGANSNRNASHDKLQLQDHSWVIKGLKKSVYSGVSLKRC